MATERIQRVEQAVKEEVAMILQRELKDPRVGFVTITRARVTADLQQATVYFSVLEGRGDMEQTEAGLRSAQGFIRTLLGSRLHLRVTPQIQFRLDETVGRSIRIAKLLKGIEEGEGRKNP